MVLASENDRIVYLNILEVKSFENDCSLWKT